MINYYQKYIKYKTKYLDFKYLDLKKNLYGGVQSISKKNVNDYTKKFLRDLFQAFIVLAYDLSNCINNVAEKEQMRDSEPLWKIIKGVTAENINSKLNRLWPNLMSFIEEYEVLLETEVNRNEYCMHHIPQDISSISSLMDSFSSYLTTNLTKKDYGINIKDILNKHEELTKKMKKLNELINDLNESI